MQKRKHKGSGHSPEPAQNVATILLLNEEREMKDYLLVGDGYIRPLQSRTCFSLTIQDLPHEIARPALRDGLRFKVQK